MEKALRCITWMVLLCLLSVQVKATTYDWLGGTSSDATDSRNWAPVQTNVLLPICPGVPGPGDDVRIGVATTYTIVTLNVLSAVCVLGLSGNAIPYNSTTNTNYPTIPVGTAMTWGTLTIGPQKPGNTLTVNGGLTVTGDITLAPNSTTGSTNPNGLNFLRGTGSISCNNLQIGGGSTVYASNDYLLSYVNTLTVNNNVNVIINSSNNNGSGFRLEDGDMFITGQIAITNPNNVAVNTSLNRANFGYFTINSTTSTGTSAKTNPTLTLYNANALSIPTNGTATVNFNGNRGGGLTSGRIDVIYKATGAQTIYTTSTAGFGSANFGNGVINTTVPTYDNLYIQNTGLATIGTGTGVLLVDSLFRTAANTTFATNSTTTTVGIVGSTAGTWTNDAGATVTGGIGTFDINGNISNAGTMTMGTGAIAIQGNYTNSGTFTANSTPTITFDGTATTPAQTLTDATSAGTAFYNVTFTGGGTKTMATGSKFTVAPAYTLNVTSSSTLTVGGTTSPAGTGTTALTLLSNAAGDASIGSLASSTSTGTITGSINVNRWVKGPKRRYMLLSSPVLNSTSTFNSTGALSTYNLLPLIATTFITGPGGSAGGFDNAPATNNSPSVFIYDENTGITQDVNQVLNNEYKPFSTTSQGVPAGNGFLYYFRGSRGLTNPFVPPYPLADNTTLNFFGTVIKGGTGTNAPLTVNVITFPLPAPLNYTATAVSAPQTLSFLSSAGTVKKGLNLLGNPYPSVIDLKALYTLNGSIHKFFYMLIQDAATGNNSFSTKFALFDASVGTTGSAATGASRYALSGQGFFVLATSAVAYKFDESLKVPYSSYSPPTPPVFNVVKNPLVLNAASFQASSTGDNKIAAAKQSSVVNTNSASTNVTDPMPRLRLELAQDSVVHNSTDINFDKTASAKFVPGEDAPYFQPSGQGDIFYSLSADSIGCFANYTTDLEKIKRINLMVTFSKYAQYKITSPFKQNIDDRYALFLRDNYTKDSLDIVHNNVYTFTVDNNKSSYAHDRFYLTIGIAPGHEYKLRSFTGTKVTTGLQLNWQTDNESTFTRFVVEKSTNGGQTFAPIDSLQSTAISEYSFIDHTPGPGQVTYRLNQFLVDGTSQLSKNLVFDFASANNSLTKFIVYPTNAVQQIHINLGKAYNNNVKLNIVNSSGGLVQTFTTNGTELMDRNISDLLKGMYVVEAIDQTTGKRIGSAKFYKQ